jgi:hypothetical protein
VAVAAAAAVAEVTAAAVDAAAAAVAEVTAAAAVAAAIHAGSI